jgi:CubicO group peptidase (beta-lactamase class C family)
MRFVILAGSLLFVARQASGQQIDSRTWTSLDSMMRVEMSRTRTPGAQIAIVERGRLVYTRGYGLADLETGRAVTERTLFHSGSLAKLFTGMLVAQLASNGTLDLKAPASRYIPEIAGREVGTSTAHELLTHSAGWLQSGIPWGRSDDAALDAAHRTVGDTMLVPGLRGIYSYSNPSFAMAAYIAERAAARPFASLLDSILLRPLSMARSTLRPMVAMTYDVSVGYTRASDTAAGRPVRPMPGNSAEWGAGFLYTNAAETVRLAMAMMDGGMLDGRRVLAADAIRVVTTGHVGRGGSQMLRAGYGMNNDSVGTQRIWQKGGSVDGYRSLLTMWPAKQFAVAIFVNQTSDLTYQATSKAAQIVAGIAPAPVATDASVPTERDPTPAERAELAGVYRLGRRTFELREVDGRLVRIIANPLPVRMTGTDQFIVRVPNGEVNPHKVVRDADGKVQYLFTGIVALPRVRGP